MRGRYLMRLKYFKNGVMKRLEFVEKDSNNYEVKIETYDSQGYYSHNLSGVVDTFNNFSEAIDRFNWIAYNYEFKEVK